MTGRMTAVLALASLLAAGCGREAEPALPKIDAADVAESMAAPEPAVAENVSGESRAGAFLSVYSSVSQHGPDLSIDEVVEKLLAAVDVIQQSGRLERGAISNALGVELQPYEVQEFSAVEHRYGVFGTIGESSGYVFWVDDPTKGGASAQASFSLELVDPDFDHASMSAPSCVLALPQLHAALTAKGFEQLASSPDAGLYTRTGAADSITLPLVLFQSTGSEGGAQAASGACVMRVGVIP